MTTRLLISLVVFVASARAADLVPSAYLVPWTPGTTVGVQGGIPTGRTVVNITGLDATGATDVSAALQAEIDAASEGENLRLPAGTFRISNTVTFRSLKNITLSGTLDGSGAQLTTLDSRTRVPIQVGPTSGVGLPFGYDLTDVTVTSTPAKGGTSLSIGDTGFLTAGDLVMVQVWDNDLDIPVVSTEGYSGVVNQLVKVVTVTNSTTFTFAPALYDDYGGGTLEMRVLPAKYSGATPGFAVGIGVEDLIIELDNVTGGSSNGINIDQAINSWVKNVRINNALNYPIAVNNSLFIELRRNYIGPRKGGDTNGGGIVLNPASATLVEDNIILDNNPLIELNFGASGNWFTRNYGSGSYYNINHAAWNRFNLFTHNVGQFFMADGYFGGASEQHMVANLLESMVLKRMSYRHTVAANLFSRLPTDSKYGHPNISNDDYIGTANYPSDPWADFGINGEVTAINKGTGTGYQVNNAAGYGIGDTVIAVDSGTGTILAGDVVTFAGDPMRYRVAVGLSGGTITLNKSSSNLVGLRQTIADNTAITVSSDNISITLASPYVVPIWPGDPTNNFRYLHWSGNTLRYRDISTATTVATFEGEDPLHEYPNAIAPPAVGTTVSIGMANSGFQELDLRVEATMIKAANRYSDGSYEGLGGATLNSVFVESAKPQWVLDQETEFGVTFPINPYNATLYTSGSPSDIPAGYRALFATPPEEQSATVTTAGNQIAVAINKPVVIGAGGSGGFTVSSDFTVTYSAMSGSTVLLNPSRTINEGETFTITYVNPGNGVEDASGNDLASFSALAVTNYSQQGAGAIWVQAIAIGDAALEAGLTGGGAIRQPIVVTTGGVVTKLRIGIGAVIAAPQPSKVALLGTDGATVLTSGTGEVTVEDDYTVYSVTSVTIPAGTYTIACATSGENLIHLRYANAASNSSSFGYISNYATWPGATVPNDGGLSRTYAFGLRIAEESPVINATVNQLNVGTLNIQ